VFSDARTFSGRATIVPAELRLGAADGATQDSRLRRYLDVEPKRKHGHRQYRTPA